MNQIPTQVQYPWRAALRTFLAVVLATIATLNIAVPVVVTALNKHLSGDALAKLNAIAAGIATTSAVITRIMAAPAVNHWLKSIGIGATPKEVK